MQVNWELDGVAVALKTATFSKTELTLNGAAMPDIALALQRKNKAAFAWPDGRPAEIRVVTGFAQQPYAELRVGGTLIVPVGTAPFKCESCGTQAEPNDRFCPSCGKALPPPETYLNQKRLQEATVTIWVLAGLFAVFGVISYFLTLSEANDALARFADADPGATVTANGVTYSVQQLRDALAWEPWSVLITNLILAVVMTGLAFWSKWSPLAAMLVAAAVYAVVQVVNAILKPESIAQGAIMKIIIVLALARGIQAALALRSSRAAAAASA
jgi:hypothetical protein